ncbi:MAG: type II secretion system F family protein [Planctomycetota bacterium]
MVPLLTILLVLVLVALAATVLRPPRETDAAGADDRRSLVREHPVIPWVVGLVVAVALFLTTGVIPWIAGATGAVAGVAMSILLRTLASRRMSRFEYQLADSIDLMVSTLRAGGGLAEAINSAAAESRQPLRRYLQELLDRVQLGEQPEAVLTSLEQRVPLESFRLFTLTLAAHWEGGGSLATTLSNVGRTIRDRVDVARRIKSQIIETQVSVVGVLAVTYGLALLMWNNYPDRVQTFASSELGSMFIGLSILLQAVGLFWISTMTRIEV